MCFQAALLAVPDNVSLAYQIGRLLRSLAMWEQAEAWLSHAASRAEDRADWENHGLALSGLGNVKRTRGNYPEAVRFHRLALESARTHRVRRIEGDALYDLAVMCFERPDVQEGMDYARAAIAAYGPGNSQLVRMANDVAWIFMHLYGEGRFAFTVFQSIEPHVHEPAFRAVLLANMARAAAETTADHIYELAYLEAYAYMHAQRAEAGHAAAFAQLALAAIAAGHPERARHMASLCLLVAERRREGHFIIEAERMLDALGHADTAPERTDSLFPTPLPVFDMGPEDAETKEAFAADLMDAVRERRDHAPESPMRALIRGQAG